MRNIIRALAILALIISILWLCFEPDFEPAFTTVVSLSTLISTFFFQNKSTVQDTDVPVNEESKVETIQAAPKVTYSDTATHNGDNHF